MSMMMNRQNFAVMLHNVVVECKLLTGNATTEFVRAKAKNERENWKTRGQTMQPKSRAQEENFVIFDAKPRMSASSLAICCSLLVSLLSSDPVVANHYYPLVNPPNRQVRGLFFNILNYDLWKSKCNVHFPLIWLTSVILAEDWYRFVIQAHRY